MAAARAEWASLGWKLDVAVEQEQEAEVPEVAAPAVPVPAVAASAALHAQLLKTVEDMKDRLEFLEYKVRILSQNEEENWSSERFINVWLCMYACLYITIPLSLLGLFMYNFMHTKKSDSALMLPDRGFDL